jgi:hypothetical protein
MKQKKLSNTIYLDINSNEWKNKILKINEEIKDKDNINDKSNESEAKIFNTTKKNRRR